MIDFRETKCERCQSPIQVDSSSASFCAACWDEVQYQIGRNRIPEPAPKPTEVREARA